MTMIMQCSSYAFLLLLLLNVIWSHTSVCEVSPLWIYRCKWWCWRTGWNCSAACGLPDFFFKLLRLDNSTGLSKIPFIITNKIKTVQHFQSIALLNLCLIVCPCTQKEISVWVWCWRKSFDAFCYFVVLTLRNRSIKYFCIWNINKSHPIYPINSNLNDLYLN